MRFGLYFLRYILFKYYSIFALVRQCQRFGYISVRQRYRRLLWYHDSYISVLYILLERKNKLGSDQGSTEAV